MSSTAATSSGTLYVVGTPIGNLEDMTFRAVRILQSVDRIAAEDTRHTGKLLQHFDIQTPQISYYEHNRSQRQSEIVAQLQAGDKIALVCDAGMPGISDPGRDLVAACVAAEILVVPIPSATAATTALAVAGLPSDRFVFEGFLPAKGKERQKRLAACQNETRTLIFYEAPHRLIQTLSDLAAILGGDRPVVLAREITKLHETFTRTTLKEALSHQPKGEYTLIIGGSSDRELLTLSDAQIKAEIQQLMQQGMSPSQASRQLAQLICASRREIYRLAIEWQKEQRNSGKNS